MLRLNRGILSAALIIAAAFVAQAQTAPTPIGHWEGAIETPNAPVKVEVDLSKNTKGELFGTFTNSGEGVKGYPLASVIIEGKTLRLVLKASAAGGTFEGVLADDGKTISGKFNMAEGGHSLPFSLTRTGEARIEAPAAGRPIGKELEGTWSASFDANGTPRQATLVLSNLPDGTASKGILQSGGVEFLVILDQKGKTLNVDAKSVGGSYSGTLSADGTELAGTWTQGAAAIPITFKRVK